MRGAGLVERRSGQALVLARISFPSMNSCAPVGSLLAATMAVTCASCTTRKDLLPEATSMLRVSVEYPARVIVTLCCPGASPGKLNGVTQLESLRPSM